MEIFQLGTDIQSIIKHITLNGILRLTCIYSRRKFARDFFCETVTIQNSSLNALKLFRLNPGEFDLVITDLSMPNMTGVQLAEEFLKIRPDIPLIICSGLNEKNNQEKAKLVGVTRFMAKPITFSELSQQVSIALEGK
ncbi:response regulator [Desulfogranum marinum]|uniref:response regulator n=1 Tax=Desulfogranum marinum TaxID=453220 RepID=UPI0019644A4C|nr:response regulator [Desulfogranum marinum]MBM9511568.1 response regulator [Desulfogranum marinum]